MKGVGERETLNHPTSLEAIVIIHIISYRSVCRNLSDHIIFQLQRNGAERREKFQTRRKIGITMEI